MTDKIIKDLEKVRYHLTASQHKAVIDDAIEALLSQKAEIERLKAECGNQSALWSKHYENIFETAKETIKSEAVKEFAERLQDRCNKQGGCLYASDIGAELNETVGDTE